MVCQYQVSFAGGLPLRFNVTPTLEHCGELLVGFAGVLGNGFTVTEAGEEVAEQVFASVTVTVYEPAVVAV